MSAKDFASHWVDAYAKSYQGGSQGRDDSTQSAIDLSKIDALVDALNGFSKAIMSGKYAEKISAAVAKTVKFEYPENIDLLHFLKNLKPSVEGDSSVLTAMDKVEKAARAAIVNNKTTARSSYKKYKDAEGIAIYLPQRLYLEAKYADLGFSKASMWDDMILVLRSQRDVKETVDNACKGEFKGLKSAISEAKKNPRSQYARMLVRELNYVAYTEKKIPAKDQAEFDKLFKNLKSAMQAR